MTQVEVEQKMKNDIKYNVDYLYELTKDGYEGTVASLGQREQVFFGILRKRNVITRNNTGKKNGKSNLYLYKWNCSMSPTNLFYNNVLDWYRIDYMKSNEKAKAERRMKKKESTPAGVNNLADKETLRKATLKDYSAQELMDELRSRGYDIVDNKMVRIIKEYLD